MVERVQDTVMVSRAELIEVATFSGIAEIVAQSMETVSEKSE